MKTFFSAIFFILIFHAGFAQSGYYVYPTGVNPSEKPGFFNVDSVLTSRQYSFFACTYDSIDAKLANFDIDVLGERPKKSFVEGLDHTVIKDINIVLQEDTVTLKMRAFVYKNLEEADNVYQHLDKMVVSGIIVPDYRIIYKKEHVIYITSLKSYFRKIRKQFPAIIYPIYNAMLAQHDNNTYLLFKHDLRKRRNEPMEKF